MYALCSGRGALTTFRSDIAFFEEIRACMARFDVEERKARGEAIPPDVEVYPKSLTASAIEAGGVTDICAAAGIGRPDLSHLDGAFIARMRAQRNPSLAIEALHRVIEQEMRAVTRHNLVKQTLFSERLADLMRRYNNQNLTAATTPPTWSCARWKPSPTNGRLMPLVEMQPGELAAGEGRVPAVSGAGIVSACLRCTATCCAR